MKAKFYWARWRNLFLEKLRDPLRILRLRTELARLSQLVAPRTHAAYHIFLCKAASSRER